MALPTAAELRKNAALRFDPVTGKPLFTSAELLSTGLSAVEVATMLNPDTANATFGPGGNAKATRNAAGYTDTTATTDGNLSLVRNGGTRPSTYNPRAANDLAEINPAAASVVNAQVDAASPAFAQSRTQDLAMQAYMDEYNALWQDISGSKKGLTASTPDAGSLQVQQASARARRRRIRANAANSTNPTGGQGIINAASTGSRGLIGS